MSQALLYVRKMRLREFKWLIQGHMASNDRNRIQTHKSLMSDCTQPVYHTITLLSVLIEKTLLLEKTKLENSSSLSLSLREIFGHENF